MSRSSTRGVMGTVGLPNATGAVGAPAAEPPAAEAPAVETQAEPLAELARLAAAVTGGSACFRSLDGRVLGSAGLLDAYSYDLGPAGLALVDLGGPAAVPDAALEGRLAGHALVTGPPFVRAWARLPVPGPSGEPAAWLDVADVIPRLLPEERLAAVANVARHAVAALTAPEAPPAWREALTHVPAPIFLLRVDGPLVRLLDGNAAARLVASADVSARFGGPLEELLPWTAPHRVGERCLRVHATGVPEDFELVLGVSSGPRLVYRVRIFPLPEAHLGAAVEDVTERVDAHRRNDAFMTVVSHELRTPLAAIRGAVGLLEGGVAGPLPDNAARLVGIAREGTERLGRMLGDLLDLERLRAGLLPLRSEPIVVSDLLATAVAATSGAARAAGVTVQTVVERDGTVAGDRERLAQALTNLLSNAVKSSPSGGSVRVRVSRPTSARVRVEVRDDGRGLSPEDAARIFAPFPSAEGAEARVRGGVALGVAISRFVVEGHGGTIGVTCPGGQGATFWVELPTLTEGR